ncbi:hypothetical protein NKH85_15780 [Mesorhizobium sp. M0924]|uniref:hypothetical protein n=1 Tax=unclassified Mesorhizobium TaxID=325217 RepID=UPI003334ACAF
MAVIPEFTYKNTMIAFRANIGSLKEEAKMIENARQKESILSQIDENVKVFESIYENNSLSLQEFFREAQSFFGVLSQSVACARFGIGSPELNKLIDRQTERAEDELLAKMSEEQMRMAKRNGNTAASRRLSSKLL